MGSVTLFAALGFFMGLPLVALARNRSGKVQALSFPDCEQRLASAASDDPSVVRCFPHVSPEDFSCPELSKIWRQATDAAPLLDSSAVPLSERGSLDEAARRVRYAAEERGRGRAGVRPACGGAPVLRVPPPVKPLEVVLVGSAVAAAFAVAASISEGQHPFILAALLLAVVGLTVSSVVDVDTLRLDMAFFWPLLLVSWLLMISARLSEGSVGSLLSGVMPAVGVVVVLELSSRLLQAFAGRELTGQGDYVLIMGAVGLPSAAAGSVTLGVMSFLMSSSLAAMWVAFRGPHRVLPLPFGPFIALGWVLVWPALQAFVPT